MCLALLVAVWCAITGMASTVTETDVYVNKTLSNLCPYMNFCHRNASKVFEDDEHKPCCAPCSCEDDCFELESCCPDKVSSHPQAAPLTCKETEVKRLGSVSGPSFYPVYRVVDTCPVGERNLTLVQKCRGENRTDIKDYQWVSDKRTGRIFQNHYCARCHDYNQIEVWDIQTQCIQALQAGFKYVANILMNVVDCNIINVAPDSFETLVQKYICSDEKGVPKCNEIGASLNHSDACATIWLPYVNKNNIYKNVYCYMCSDYFEFESVPEVCEKSDGEYRTDTNFQLLLNFGNLKDEDDSDATVCDIDEIFDIRLVCISNYKNIGGRIMGQPPSYPAENENARFK